MYRSRRLVAMLIIMILGLQTAAMAAHTHFPATGSGENETHHMLAAMTGEHDSHAGSTTGDHHSASCVVAQSCFPAVDAAAPITTPPVLKPARPNPSLTTSFSSAPTDPLLRPPRMLA